MIPTLVEKNINLLSRGGEWLLLVLEEAHEAHCLGKPFSIRRYLISLKCKESDIKAAYTAMRRELLNSGNGSSITNFIKECLES